MHQKDQRLDFDEIEKLKNSPLKEGDTWYILDKKWFDMCKAYHEKGDKSDHPGPIDNTALFQPIPESNSRSPSNGFRIKFGEREMADFNPEASKFKSPQVDAVSVDSRPLRSDISECEGDFVYVPEKCWNLLKDCFGIVSPNHAIRRQVIRETTYGMEIIEFNLLKLKLCLYGGKEANVERQFSRTTTVNKLQHEMRKLFNISPDCESKLWINSVTYPWEPSTSLSPSKSDNNIQSGSSSPKQPFQPVSTNTNSSPNVVTRQAAHSMNRQPIALPDSSTPPSLGSSILTTSTSDSPIGGTSPTKASPSSFKGKEDNPTLGSIGMSETGIVTLEIINSDGTWPSSRPRHGTVATRSSKAQPGLCGLANLGNTCFMNAALQCLSNTPPLTNYILTDKFLDDINTSNPLGMHGEIARTYADLVKLMWSGNHSSFVPREFKCAVSRFAPQFNGFAQQDCQELMAFLLDGLHEDLNRIRNKPYIETKNETELRPDDVVAEESWSNYKKRNDSIVVDTFHAMLKSTLVCPGCKLVSVTFDPFCYLSLPLPVKREKQTNLTFIPAPSKIDESKLSSVFEKLDPEEVKTIQQYGGSLSSSSGFFGEYAGYSNPTNCPKSCKLQVPRSGPVSEICDIVSRIINEENSNETIQKVKPNNLVVAEISADGRISKVYESNEHYNQISDDIVVVEKASSYVIPLYLRERKTKNSTAGTVIAKPLFLHVPDLKFKTLYLSTLASLSNLTDELHDELQQTTDPYSEWIKLIAPSEDSTKDCVAMDCEDEDEDDSVDQMSGAVANTNGDSVCGEAMDIAPNENLRLNGNSVKKDLSNSSVTSSGSNGNSFSNNNVAFDLCIVNSFGSHAIETLSPSSKECDYDTKLYLGATITPAAASLPQFIHLRQSKFSDFVETFTPKVLPKPTLQLKDCITQFTTVERLGADDPWYCPKCKKHQQATKKFDIWSLPKVLIICLKRFSFSRSWRDKIDTLVEFPVENLDLSNFVLCPQQKKLGSIYNLIGVANHFGGLGGGHYTAYAKNAPQNAWYNFDDVSVSLTSASNVVTRSAYVLFYQLQEGGQA